MMTNSKADQAFPFDVAFSFLSADEKLATDLSGALTGRLKTFIYTEQQKKLVGNDGEKLFNQAFGHDARLVVVLHREGWGDGGWTGVEKTAIRNRGFEEGYEFTLFVPTGTPPSVPAWLPKAQIWLSLDRLGLDGAVSIIEARVADRGGTLRQETVHERAERVEAEHNFEKERARFLASEAGVAAAQTQFEELVTKLTKYAEDPSLKKLGMSIVRHSAREAEVRARMACLAFDWRPHWANTLDEAELTIGKWAGIPPRNNNYFRGDEPTQHGQKTYTFDVTRDKQHGWSTEGKFVSTDNLADLSLFWLMEADASERR